MYNLLAAGGHTDYTTKADKKTHHARRGERENKKLLYVLLYLWFFLPVYAIIGTKTLALLALLDFIEFNDIQIVMTV